jgi:hypothetical protein
MTLKTCPPPEMLSAYIDRELRPAEYPDLDAHLLQCAQCSEVLSGLRSVDAALRDMPAPPLFRPRVSVVSRPTRKLRRAAVILLVLALILTVAAGCAFGARLLGVFRTEHHVMTQPATEFPAEMRQGIVSGPEIETALPRGNDIWSIEEVEASLGAHLLEPSYLPADYVLRQRSSLFKMFVEVLYLKSADESITIRESNHEFGGTERPPVPPLAAESVTVAGKPAIYVEGGWYQEEPSDVPAWRDDIARSLLFDVGDLTVEIVSVPGLPEQDLIRIAESMR